MATEKVSTLTETGSYYTPCEKTESPQEQLHHRPLPVSHTTPRCYYSRHHEQTNKQTTTPRTQRTGWVASHSNTREHGININSASIRLCWGSRILNRVFKHGRDGRRLRSDEMERWVWLGHAARGNYKTKMNTMILLKLKHS